MKPETSLAPRPASITPELLAQHSITPELLAQHSITPEEYARIEAALGRTPSLTELGIYSVMWSEHCSYKSSRVHLKRLPTESPRVVQGPGENAGIIDVGDGWACAFKIESHNHPSYIEPFQGAATGVGGILRDIFTMGARPLAVMDSLRFGPIDKDSEISSEVLHKNHSIVEGVVHGIAAYGNCFGVPNLGGETKFEPCYSGNPLVNAFALGLVRRDEIFYAKATGIGNPVIYVGAKTGRDGIHGATMASEEFKEGSEQKRPNVQVGDPFMEKLLLEACIEAMRTGAIVGIQDMGAAGLTSSSCEMGARGGVGLEMNLDQIPQRETGMTAYEMMLSESQERMLLVAEKGREQEIFDVFTKWGLDATIVGTVIAEPRLRILHRGELEADIPNQSLTDDAPRYHRPIGTWKAPVPLDPPAEVLEVLKQPRDYTADLKKLLASSNISSKRWVYEQYDSMVQTNTAQGPGGEAGVMRIKGSGTPGHERGLAMALDGNSRWCYLDPKQGAKLAVAEAARKVACTGATPVAATNCLNFGNPEKPEIMAQLSSAIDGLAEACTALGTPITGGNVSLYNETKGEGIYPTPVIGIVGVIDDVTKTVSANFQQADDHILLIRPNFLRYANEQQRLSAFGSSEYAKVVLNKLWGTVPMLDLGDEAALQKVLIRLAAEELLHSACDISDGGLAVTLAEAGFVHGIGVHVASFQPDYADVFDACFSETSSSIVITCDTESRKKIEKIIDEYDELYCDPIGTTTSDRFELIFDNKIVIHSTIADLKQPWSTALKSSLHDQTANEVLA
ncbi:phosphoribosylformylglycinamidine synthase subunit PurL [Paracidobacterium acidisoli]|uniref:Phosphoribosylformylglycinamidine synthase subunit PurL n=1 Tax=Paracidobacterium acidisoli TaxID=2303751 RepID=A0A372ILA8_9BACT|nr:phosphoribosylformylglycinamidine synthase subunit PurL [Paracidobacterium acidisoli]MBT9332331.1 phosphoribosylformylglycinamidine synthase subunit PurL [Paracidobacterium acidisoli]